MFLQFVPKTHLFFTAGKDRKIKQWDADKFEHIQTLEVTLAHIWGVTELGEIIGTFMLQPQLEAFPAEAGSTLGDIKAKLKDPHGETGD